RELARRERAMALGVTPQAPVTRMFSGATSFEDSPRWLRRCMPAAGIAFVRAAEEGSWCPGEDPQVEEGRAVLDVPDVELDPLRPGQHSAAVHLRPAGDAGLHVEPVPLPFVVLLDLVAQRRSWPDHAHLATDDVPELWQLVERELAQEPARARDTGVVAVDGEPGADCLGTDDHRPQLEELEVGAVPAHARLAIEDRPAVLELDGERSEREERRGDKERSAGDRHVGGAGHASSSRCGAHGAGTPRRR